VLLTDGGARLILNGEEQGPSSQSEYSGIYREFVDLIDERRSSVDLRPLRLVADCLLASKRRAVEPVVM
jgi:D-galactose 1-dehydrogenase